MSRFENCRTCSRLNVRGARCVCTTAPTMTCDCSYDGNQQIIGPICSQRIRDVWAECVRTSRQVARNLAANPPP